MYLAWLLFGLLQSSPAVSPAIDEIGAQYNLQNVNRLNVGELELIYGVQQGRGGLLLFVSRGRVVDSTSYCPYCPAPIQVLDLDADGRDEIIVTDYTYGAHCCTSYEVYRPNRGTVDFVAGLFAGNGFAEFRDLDGDGIVEIILWNDDFAYFETPFATSPWYFNVLQLKNNRLVDVTPKFRTQVNNDINKIVSRIKSGGKNYPLTSYAVELYARCHLIGEDRRGMGMIRKYLPDVVPWFLSKKRYIERTIDSSLSRRIYYARDARPF